VAVRKLADGKWQARWRDENGVQRAQRFRTRAEAQDHLVTVQADKRRGLTTRDAAMTVAELADAWLNSAMNLSSGSRMTYRRDLDRYIFPRFGSVQIGKVTALAIEQWIKGELDRLAPSSVHRHYRTLRTMFGFAVKRELLIKNPCAAVTAPRVPRTDMRIFTVEQIEAIADVIAPRYRCFVLLAAYGGLRLSELVGLRRMDVNGNQVTVAGQLLLVEGKWERTAAKTIAGHRTITVSTTVAEELAVHLDTYTGPEPDDLVFTNQQGRPVGPSFRQNVWAPACAKVGLGSRTIKNHKPAFSGIPRFHDLRHTAASLAIAAGAHPKTIQQRLGHSSIVVTMDRYGHLMAGVDQQLADDLDRMRRQK
jgi:integrase